MVRAAVEGTVGALTLQNIEMQVQVQDLEQRCAALNAQLTDAQALIAALQANAAPATS